MSKKDVETLNSGAQKFRTGSPEEVAAMKSEAKRFGEALIKLANGSEPISALACSVRTDDADQTGTTDTAVSFGSILAVLQMTDTVAVESMLGAIEMAEDNVAREALIGNLALRMRVAMQLHTMPEALTLRAILAISESEKVSPKVREGAKAIAGTLAQIDAVKDGFDGDSAHESQFDTRLG